MPSDGEPLRINRIGAMKSHISNKIHQQLGRFVSGKSIWEYEWDILCILDACRADEFRRYRPNAGSYTSVASNSKEWIKRTFNGRNLENIGYITGNPFAADLNEHAFGYFHQEPVVEVGGIETVPPAVLRDHAVTAWNELDLDQLIIHYMQPHVPFLTRPEWFNEFRNTDVWGSNAINRVEKGDIDHDDWMKAYRFNLSWVLGEGVGPLVGLVDGTVAVSADHGNGHGEWGLYGHPSGCAISAVREVPWWTFEAQKIHDIEPVDLTPKTLTTEETKRQLAELGYRGN